MKYLQPFSQGDSDICAHEGGVALVEFAICIFVLLLLFFGATEVARFMLVIEKVEKAVNTITDVTSQSGGLTEAGFDTQTQQLMNSVSDMLSPYSSGPTDPNVYAILTDVSVNGTGAATKNWAYCGGGTGTNISTPVPTTKLTYSAGMVSNPALGGQPAGSLTLVTGEEVVIGELFYEFQPVIANNGVLGSALIYRISILRVRGTIPLTTFSPPSTCS